MAARRPDGRRIPFWENPEYTLVLQKKPTVAIVPTYGINRYLPRWEIFYPYRKWSYTGLLPTAKDIIVKKISRQSGELPSGEIPPLDIGIEFGSIMA